MRKNNGVVSDGQGPSTTKSPEILEMPSIERVREYVQRDMATAITMLDAVYKDVNTLNALCDYLHGRIMNEFERQERVRREQPELPLK